MINPYDSCVAKKWTDEGQLTVVWHVNDMKVFHKNKEEVTKFIKYTKVINGEEMILSRGKKHTYVIMDLNYSTPGEVIVSMESYITEAIDKFPEETMNSIKTLTGNHLLKADNSCEKLWERAKIIFHRLVDKLLSLSKHARTGTQPTIAFLTTRVINPDEDDWKKLQRALSYLDATINNVKLHLNANNMNFVHWWVDESYGTHTDLKGQK